LTFASKNSILKKAKERIGFMNKKEILEIKKLFAPDNGVINKICGCYVDAEKNIKFTSKDSFINVSLEDSYKYYDIFKSTLSGTVGKNLHTLDFPLSEENIGGKQDFLYTLINTELEDDELLLKFYNNIIENYTFAENYYIILILGTYDVPGKASDGTEMFDASNSIYQYILCSICPVKLSKAALGYDTESNCIHERIRDWVVENPAKGFLYPAFTDRQTDLHSVLYYTKNAEEIDGAFIEELFGANQIPVSAKTQNESFNNIITETLNEEATIEVLTNLHENFKTLVDDYQATNEEEPLILTKNTVKQLFNDSGVSDEAMKNFDKAFTSEVGENAPGILANNISSMKNLVIESNEISIKVKPEFASLVTTQMIDGKKCFVIPVSDCVSVSGISVS